MARPLSHTFAIAILASLSCVWAQSCDVYARTQAGPICGSKRLDARRVPYASFRGVPYAKQPLGELRFKPLQPLEGWKETLNASVEGAVCPQVDILYGRSVQPRGMSEACIYANIHVPLHALPIFSDRPVRDLKPPYVSAYSEKNEAGPGLSVLVFIHGGGFSYGSGDSDLHGPENLVSEDIIVITFNYRLNILGFLSLNSPEIPGNNGLRDMVTLLRWVRDNVRNFGGNPGDVTLAGQSAGAASAHLLALSPAAKGLFHKMILMSGTGIPSFYTTSPAYANMLAQGVYTALGINASITGPIEIHRRLVNTTIEALMAIVARIQDTVGLVSFLPVVESKHDGVQPIIDIDTETAIASGRDIQIPMLLGFTNVECEVFRPRFEGLDIMNMVLHNPSIIVPLHLLYSLPNEIILEKMKLVEDKFYKGAPSMDKLIDACTNLYFKLPALRVAEYRKNWHNSAPLYVYEFAYDSSESVLKTAWNLTYQGAAHVEDLTYVFQVNSVNVDRTMDDNLMKWMMTTFVTNFIRRGDPGLQQRWTPALVDPWLPVTRSAICYQLIRSPGDYKNQELTVDQKKLLSFYSELNSKIV